MALTKPTLYPQVAFDARFPHTFDIKVYGGSQIVSNKLIIKNNLTGQTAYNGLRTTFQSSHLLDGGILQNGNYYTAQSQTYDSSNNASPLSDLIQFWCYTTPIVSITNIKNDDFVKSSNFTFEGSYFQAEGEKLKSYRYFLYDLNKSLIETGQSYDTTDLSHTFNGFEDNKVYNVRFEIETIEGTIVSSDYVKFSVDYISPNMYTVTNLENLCDSGQIKISSNVKIIYGESNPAPPIYIDMKEVDLREDGHYVRFPSGFNLGKDFTLRFIGRDFNEFKDVLVGSNKDNTSIYSYNFTVKYMIDDFTFKEDKIYFDMRVYSSLLNNPYYIQSNKLDIPTDKDYICISVRRINNLWDLKIINVGIIDPTDFPDPKEIKDMDFDNLDIYEGMII